MEDLGLGLGLAAIAAVTAAYGVRRFSHTDDATRLWWLASALAAGAALVAALRSGTPVPAGLAAGGIAAAVVVDAVEGRIPTPVAHGTTAVSLMALTVHATVTGEWGMVAWAVVLTTGLVLAFGVLWLAHGIGFGDVRLAAALVTAMTGGTQGLLALVYTAFILGAGVILVRRLLGRRGEFPFGPALALGWFVAVAVG